MQYGAAAQEEVREESRQTFPLSANARVKIVNINRDVIIETSASEVAEVEIIRLAKRQRHLKYHPVSVEHSPAGLIIKGKEDQAAYRRGIEVKQHVTLKIPHQASLEVRNIGGSVRLGELYGPLNVEQVSGSLEIRLAENLNADLTAKYIGGGLYINLSNDDRVDPESAAVSVTRRIGTGGIPILISKVSGSVVIR